MRKENRARRTLALTLTALLLLSLVPILLAGDCVHPYGDDYAFSQFVHHAQMEGKSLLSALAYTVKRYYFGWQGTFTATALMALQPGLISEQAYVLGPVLLLLALCLSTAALTHALLRRWLKLDRWSWLGATAGLLLVTVQYQLTLRDAFFWWNGGLYYTGYYSLMLLLFTCLIRLRLAPKHPALLWTGALLLAAVVGGGNYVTGLFTCVALGGYTLACLLWDRRRLGQAAAAEAVLGVCFLLNTLAPGNGVRQASAQGLAPLEAIWAAIVEGKLDVHAYIHLPFLALMLGLVPVLWKGLENTSFTFPLPGLVTAVLFLALCCQNTPHYYALGTAGPGRLRNIIYDSSLILMLVAEGYWLGWLRRKKGEALLTASAGKWMVETALFVAAAGFLLSYPMTAAYQCAGVLADGSAREYDRRATAWAEALSDPDTDPVYVVQLREVPYLLCSYGMAEDPKNFANETAANYYGKTAVIALPEGAQPPEN